MKNSVLKSLAVVFVMLLFVSVFSSCNRGYGCPNQFQVDKVIKVL